MLYLILDEVNDEIKNENLIIYLTDANPFVRNDGNSLDICVYKEFKDMFDKNKDSNNYYYNFICNYLKSLTYYKEIFEIFNENISKEEYVQAIEYLLKYENEWFEE